MESQIRIQNQMGNNVMGEKEKAKAQEKFIKKEQKQVTKEMLDAYMEKNPYIYQEKPQEYAYLSDKEWRENDEWADRASKLMLLTKSMRDN
jgi:hypothetical protein